MSPLSLGAPPGLSLLHPLVPPVPDTEWNLSWLWFVSSGFCALLTHAECICCFPLVFRLSWLVRLAQVTPLHLASVVSAGWMVGEPLFWKAGSVCSCWTSGPPCLEFGYLVCRLLGHVELTEQVECACCPHPELCVPPRCVLIFGLCLLLWVT